MDQIKIIVATNKPYRTPADNIYLPLQVGADGKESIGYLRDNEGLNISKKNPYYCELTGLYWAINNLDADYLGLVHYRRYFSKKRFARNDDSFFENVLSEDDARKILEKHDIILPKKRHYVIDSIYGHYKHTLFVEPLDKTGEIIRRKYPAYYPEFQRLKKRRSGHTFNMIIAKRDIMDDYCAWLFDILSELEKEKIDISNYSTYQKRFYGFISERLLDVYINTHDYAYYEMPVANIQHQNWPKKIHHFLRAKLSGVKYESSF